MATEIIPDQYTVLRNLDDCAIVLFSAHPITWSEAESVFSKIQEKVQDISGTAKSSLDHAVTMPDGATKYSIRDDAGYIFDVIVPEGDAGGRTDTK